MACQSCTRDELCIACRFEGREQRLPRYAGRRGETLLRRNDKAALDYFAEAEDSPVWNDPMVAHLTKVGPVPFLCFYCWTGQVSGGARVVPADDWAALEDLRLPG